MGGWYDGKVVLFHPDFAALDTGNLADCEKDLVTIWDTGQNMSLRWE